MTTQRAEAAPGPAIDIRFGQVGLIQVLIWTTDPGAILDELTGRVATAPKFFQRTAVSIDLGPLGREPSVQEMQGVLDAVRRAGMCPVGLASGAPVAQGLSEPLDLPLLPPFREFHPPAEAGAPAVRRRVRSRSPRTAHSRSCTRIPCAPASGSMPVAAIWSSPQWSARAPS